MVREKGLSFYKKESKLNKALFHRILELIISSVVVIFLALAVTYVFGARTGVIGDSMEPEIPASSQVLINRFVYMVTSPKTGDVIVFLPYGNTNTHYYIKRVVAVPGDTVQITDGRLYVNGYVSEAADEYDLMEDAGIAEDPITLGEDEYFTLGDNRNSSEDSRSGNIGAVKKENIVGEAWLMISSADGHISLVN